MNNGRGDDMEYIKTVLLVVILLVAINIETTVKKLDIKLDGMRTNEYALNKEDIKKLEALKTSHQIQWLF